MLERQNPQTRYEVINAAGFERRIHQSFLQYLESLSQFQPDLIINLEGMNDVYSIASGTPFADVEEQLPFYAELYEPAAVDPELLRHVLRAVDRLRKVDQSPPLRRTGPDRAHSAGGAGRLSSVVRNQAARPGWDRYEKQKGRYQQQRRAAAADSSPVFCGPEDRRSAIALRAAAPVGPHQGQQAALRDGTPIRCRHGARRCRFTDAARRQRADPDVFLRRLSLRRRSPRRRPNSASRYVDMNAEIAELGPEVEFYTDYCHLTPEGNQRVAEILARKIPRQMGATRGGSSPPRARRSGRRFRRRGSA